MEAVATKEIDKKQIPRDLPPAGGSQKLEYVIDNHFLSNSSSELLAIVLSGI